MEDKVEEVVESEALHKVSETEVLPKKEIAEPETGHTETPKGEEKGVAESVVDGPVETVEEEISESVTEIEEIFQVSEDGVNWKTVKKITTITPRGTSERVVVLGGI